MIRLAIFVIVLILLYKLLCVLVKGSGASDWQETSDDRSTAELVQDPQCGAYVLPAQGVSARLAGKTYHFCSEACRARFLLEHSK